MTGMRPETGPCCPRRSDNVIEVGVDDDLLLYHFEHNRAYCLNAEATELWRRCDGRTPLAQILEPGDEVGYQLLARLQTEGMITGMAGVDRPEYVTRRAFVQAGGAAAAGAVMLPLIQSLAIPGVAAAASGLPYDRTRIVSGSDNTTFVDANRGSDPVAASDGSTTSGGQNAVGQSSEDGTYSGPGTGKGHASKDGPHGHVGSGIGSDPGSSGHTNTVTSGQTTAGGKHAGQPGGNGHPGHTNAGKSSHPSTSFSGNGPGGSTKQRGSAPGGSSNAQGNAGSGSQSLDGSVNTEGGELSQQPSSVYEQLLYRLKRR